ncbi:MAG: lysophospholipid acyltransferase family protein [Nevskiales bacterium]|nr:lysophospholipid acyltransferase family protein [Nevskiales bacterium]
MTDRIEIGATIPRWHNRFLYWLGRTILRSAGWRIDVRLPDLPKMVIIAAPHTSNWDFVFGMAAVLTLQVRLHWYAKHTLFQGWYGGFFRWLGGLPVDRSAPGGVVEQTTRAFAERPQLIIAIAPEGTRSRRERWKHGFYHMARGANVPVVAAYIDYRRREVGIGPVFTPTGDWAADMKPVFDFYRGIQPRRPGNFAIETL